MGMNRHIVLSRFFPIFAGRQFLLSSSYLSAQYEKMNEIAAIG